MAPAMAAGVVVAALLIPNWATSAGTSSTRIMRVVKADDAAVSAAFPRRRLGTSQGGCARHRAEDLLQTVLARVYGRWPRVRDGVPDAYLRAMLATTYLNWWRRRWRSWRARRTASRS